MSCKHKLRVLDGLWVRLEPGVIVARHGIEVSGPCNIRTTFERCVACGEIFTGITANDVGVEHEIAAARLIAGYVTSNDTDDTLADPIAREVLDWQLDESPPLSEAAIQCDALYGVIAEHIDRDEPLSAEERIERILDASEVSP